MTVLTLSPNRATVSRDEAAQFLGLKSQTLASWATKGQGPRFIKVGRLARYRMADLEAYLTSRTVASTGEAANL